jgi:hypothetical protein
MEMVPDSLVEDYETRSGSSWVVICFELGKEVVLTRMLRLSPAKICGALLSATRTSRFYFFQESRRVQLTL